MLSQKEVHPQECADAAACYGHPDEGRLRYAPLPAAGLPFVDSEDKEGQDIDADEIYDDCSQDHLVVRLKMDYGVVSVLSFNN